MPAPGSTSSRPTVATAPSIAARRLAHAQDELGRLDERVVARGHRRRARVAGAPLEDELALRVAHDPGHDAERRAEPGEHRSLLDVQLDVAAGQRTSGDERAAPVAAALLVAEDDDAERPPAAARAHDRLEPRDDAERAVVLAARGDGVQVRARPDLGQLGPLAAKPPDDVPDRVPLDLEPGLLHPAGGELARPLLLRRPADAVGSRPAAERVQLVEPIVNPSG